MLRKIFKFDLGYFTFWFVIIVLIFFFPVVIGRQSLTQNVPTFYSAPSPIPSVQIPWQVDAGTHTNYTILSDRAGIRMIKEGIPPLWTNYIGGGQQLAGDIGTELYYPLRLIFFFAWNSARAFDWYFILRFFIAGLGMFLYLRAIGLQRIVSIWGGIAYAFTGYFILYISYPFLDIDSLLPWTLLAIEVYFREKRIRRAALVGFFLAMTIVIGQPQSTIIAFLLAVLYFIWKAALMSKTRKEQFSVIRHSIFIILIAILIASPFIADFLTFASQGTTIAAWQSKGLLTFKPIQILHFLITPTMMPEVAASGHLFDRYEIIIPYVGISILLLFLLSFFIKKKPPQLAPLYVWIAFVVLKNAGFPLVQWIGKLPILSQVGWYKAYGPMAGAMVICAAIAFENILREPSESAQIAWHRFYKLIAAIPLLFIGAYIFFRSAFIEAYVPNFDFFNRHADMVKKVMALLARWPEKIKELAFYIMQNHGEYFTLFLFIEAIIFGGAALILIRYLRNDRHQKRAAIALVILTAFELWWYMPKIRDGFQYIDPYKQTPPYVSFLEERLSKEEIFRTFPIGKVFQGDLADQYKIPKANSETAMKPRRYFMFLPDEILREDALSGIIPADKLPAVPQKFFDAYDIRYLLSEKTLATRPGLELIYDADLKIYRNNSALPKAYVVFQKETAASPENARSIFYGASFDPHTSIILEDRNAISLPQTAHAPLYSPAVVTRYTDNEVDLTAKTDQDGILVLTDIFYPGWQAYLDGKKVITYPANVMFRGIFLPAGSHTVRFVYEPWWFWPSVTVSLATIITIATVAFYSIRKKRGAMGVKSPRDSRSF